MMGATAITLNSANQSLGDLRAAQAHKSVVTGDDKRLKAVAAEFESFFISMLFKQMRKSIKGDHLLSGGKAEEVFQTRLDDQMSVEMGKQGRFGIADIVFDQLKKMQPTVSGNKAAAAYKMTSGEQ
jgi:peptidoglycan hydrolase FlgJ